MIDDTKYKQFEIEITEKTADDLQVEIIDAGSRRMVLVTDLREIRPKTYRQEAYGPAYFLPTEVPELIEILKKKLLTQRG